jgi:murein endopeptidase
VSATVVAAFCAGAVIGGHGDGRAAPLPPVIAHGEPVRPEPQSALGPLVAHPRFPSRPSLARGSWAHGHLVRGVMLPAAGEDYVTWDPVLERVPDRAWRRWGTDRLVRLVLEVLREFRAAHPGIQRILVGDLSRPHGGEFGARFGGLGHMSHQNGLDADVYYPRRDRLQRKAIRPSQIDRPLAADLLHRFVRAGAIRVFVGPHTGLRGPRRIVQPLVHHDDHMHVRIR